MLPGAHLGVPEAVQEAVRGLDAQALRALLLVLDRDTVVVGERVEASDDVAADCERIAAAVHERPGPCFLLFRPPEEAMVERWALISYVPEDSKPKLRMAHAAAQGALRHALGEDTIAFSLHCTEEDALRWESLGPEVAAKLHPETFDARTESEKVRDALDQTAMAECAAKVYVHGVQARFSDTAAAAVTQFAAGELEAVVLTLTDDQTVAADHTIAEPLTVAALVARLPEDAPRFVLLRHRHSRDDGDRDANVFLYVCPSGGKARVRMAFSTTKASVVAAAEAAGVPFAAKLEYGDAASITEDALLAAMYPAAAADEEPLTPEPPAEKPPRVMGVRVMF